MKERETVKRFLGDDFLLDDELARELYHDVARDQPIIDYHTHLSPEYVAKDHRFETLTEIWLKGDHYKWRALRWNGVEERLITGPASDWDKFLAWARTVPYTVGNPLYHWTQMELKRPFGITRLLDETTARSIYDDAGKRLAEDGFGARGLLRQFDVRVVCTTDDPVDSLEHHAAYAASGARGPKMYPTWRPDRALVVEDGPAFRQWVDRLEKAAGASVASFASFLEALRRRHQAFHDLGCRLSDHGLERMYAEEFTEADLARTFEKARSGGEVGGGEALVWRSGLLHLLAVMDAERGWVQQFHFGAMRNNNTRLFRILGADSGCDSIGDFEQARPLARFLDRLDQEGRLPKTILYNLNPGDNELMATMAGNFQDGSEPGKMQFGSAWWFLDQKDGVEAQLRALANLGLLSRFVGMLTDSRSFLSYSRHEYFRRILCNMLATDVARGLVPDDRALLRRMVRDICFENARRYFPFGLEGETAPRANP